MKIKLGIENFLTEHGFKLISSSESEHFGDYHMDYSNDIIDLRFFSDRSTKAIHIRFNKKNEDWRDLALVKALLLSVWVDDVGDIFKSTILWKPC